MRKTARGGRVRQLAHPASEGPAEGRPMAETPGMPMRRPPFGRGKKTAKAARRRKDLAGY